ncbi:hypothetical protein SAMN04488003_101304 [Loktanella fryxellensis]|uniref:Uncharacterized protein n=1 Tax=Loktanella fryxellensis TaxID=245187 RepID=A0A1H7YVI7_9RHOB|nr:hypothetical protein [Loktanella fryxellensis]SEM49357.1 hypothetical protein SAMN04488003_101304 [Loktanella fryxellensis]
MAADPLTRKTERIHALLTARLGLKGATLEAQAGRVGRRLSRSLMRDLALVVAADVARGHPRLMRQVDGRAVGLAGDRIVAHLTTVDPWEVRKTHVLRWLAGVAAVAIVAFGGVVWALRAQGRI